MDKPNPIQIVCFHPTLRLADEFVSVDSAGLEAILTDSKNTSADSARRIYVPENEPKMIEYYKKVAADKPDLHLKVEVLPINYNADYMHSINDKPGILALAMREVKTVDGNTDLQGVPFVVPGARFNELYNWVTARLSTFHESS